MLSLIAHYALSVLEQEVIAHQDDIKNLVLEELTKIGSLLSDFVEKHGNNKQEDNLHLQ